VNIGILGNKIGMTQIFSKEGKAIPVTVIKVGPCVVTNLKNKEVFGYNSIQIGYSQIVKSSKKINKGYLNYFEKQNLPVFRYLKEFRLNETTNYKIGDSLNLNCFQIGQKVKIKGLTIGKGNTGNIKRHGFSRGAMSHGSKHHRLQGSIGAGTSPGRVFPGKKMPGRVGRENRTIAGLEVMDFIQENSLLVLKGSVPGKKGNLLTINLM